MCPTSETKASVTTLMQRWDTLKVVVSMTQEELEDQLHHEVWRSDWEAVLELLRIARDGVSRARANECLTLAVQKAPVEVVAAMLELLPQEEYCECDTYYVDWSPTEEICRRLKWELNVQGTMLMHAVAANRPEVVQLLLDHGYDVNCASEASAEALMKDYYISICNYGRDFLPFHPYTTRPESRVRLQKWDTLPDDTAPVTWEGATPLALAVLMGHEACARVLVERGAWLEEAPSVSAAMYLFWREKDPAYQATRAVVLQEADHARHRPVLWAAGQTCSPQQLKRILEAWDYTPRELVRAARCMMVELNHQRDLWKNYTDGWQDLCQRMYRIGKVCPAALRDKRVIGLFLDHFLRWKGADWQPLLPFLEGEVIDISGMEGGGLYMLENAARMKDFQHLAQHCRLVMDRDAVPVGLPEKVIRQLIKVVEFLPPVVDVGVSRLSQEILRTGDLRLIRKALQSGLIPPEESTEELLRCQQAQNASPVCRTALLSTLRPKKVASQKCPQYADIHNRWFGKDSEDRRAPVPERVETMTWSWNHLHRPYRLWTVQVAGREWQLSNTFVAACMGGHLDVVKRWMPYLHPVDLRNTESLLCSEANLHLVMTPLCAAAFAGQGDVVQFLLEQGCEEDAVVRGYPNVCTTCWNSNVKGENLPVNAAFAAALGGHWEVVELLLEQGAACNWASPRARRLWKLFHTEDLEETVRANLKGGAKDVSQ